MITPTCDCCGNELTDFGAIVLSPPAGLQVNKYHVCVSCFHLRIAPLFTAAGVSHAAKAVAP